MDSQRVHALRELLATTGWVERTQDFATTLRGSTKRPGGLLLLGTPQQEPWHLAAHLEDEARLSDLPQLSPVLVRHAPLPTAPAHLAVGLERLATATRGETLFVVAPDAAPEQLLQRLFDVRRAGATILSIDSGDDELADLAHERLVVPSADPRTGSRHTLAGASVDFDSVQHLVSVAAGEADRRRRTRDRLSKFLERVSGPTPRR